MGQSGLPGLISGRRWICRIKRSFLGTRPKPLVRESFARAYPALGSFFQEQVIDKSWVDWEPRPGKRPGGFCTSSMLSKESRIFMTYNDSLGRRADLGP